MLAARGGCVGRRRTVTTPSLAYFRNRQAISLAAIPRVSAEDLAEIIERSTAGDWRLLTLFGYPEGDDRLCLLAILADDVRGQLGAASAVVGQHYPSIAARCPHAALFEREIAEQCGALPAGHPSLRPLRRHEPDHAPRTWPRPAGEHVRTRLLARRRRRSSRGGGRARCTPASSSPATSDSRRTARTCSCSRSCSATSTAASSACSNSATGRARCSSPSRSRATP